IDRWRRNYPQPTGHSERSRQGSSQAKTGLEAYPNKIDKHFEIVETNIPACWSRLSVARAYQRQSLPSPLLMSHGQRPALQVCKLQSNAWARHGDVRVHNCDPLTRHFIKLKRNSWKTISSLKQWICARNTSATNFRSSRYKTLICRSTRVNL